METNINHNSIKTIAVKSLSFHCNITKISNNNDTLILVTTMRDIYSYKRKYIIYNKCIQAMFAKSLPSNYIATKVLDDSRSFILVLLTKNICNCRNKYKN